MRGDFPDFTNPTGVVRHSFIRCVRAFRIFLQEIESKFSPDRKPMNIGVIKMCICKKETPDFIVRCLVSYPIVSTSL